MTGPFARRLFCICFGLAGTYNVGFGLWTIVWPQQFFDLIGADAPRYPSLWSCIGMIVALYGLLYWYAAWQPERGWLIIAIGLAGKVLGPIGMLGAAGHEWPRAALMMNLYNDVLWWLPFLLFLIRSTVLAHWLVRSAPFICATLHLVAIGSMALILKPGMLTETSPTHRMTYIVEHPTVWCFGWMLWMGSAASLVGFYCWWAGKLTTRLCWPPLVAVLLASAGMACDLSGEFLSAFVAIESASRATDPLVADDAAAAMADYLHLERRATLLTAGAANLFYTLGGIVLTCWTSSIPNWIRVAMWGTWIAGGGMTCAAVIHSVPGMVATTAILFPLLIAWSLWMGWRWRPT